MLRIALTGGIATGKSRVLAHLAASGIPTIDADVLVHRALAAGSPAIAAIVSRFGAGVVAPDGAIDRRALGVIVFADPAARADLEAILHPQVYRLIDEWYRQLADAPRPNPGAPAIGVADIPLLFETGHAQFFDRVIVTVCPPERQIDRLRARDGMTEEEARRRLQAQWPAEEKARRADYVIDTSGSFAQTDRQVDAVIDALLRPTA